MSQNAKFSASVIPRDVQPLFAKDKGTAEAIQRAYANNLVFDIALGGKYSNGAAIALDPENERAWLLKPEVSKQSPAAGVNDLPVSKSKREAAFSEIASLVGDSDQFTKVTVVFLDGHETAAIELADTDYKNIPFLQKKPTGEQGVVDIFKDYQDSGQMWQWSFLDYVLGNTDRHSNNILIDPETEDVKLIDHGGAFAGEGFDPGGDSKTFIPYYLRSNAPKGFNTLPPEAKLRYLAKPSPGQEEQFLNWLNSIDETKVFQVLREYGIDVEPFKRRFNQLKNAKNSIGLMLKLWVKPKENLVKAEPEEKLPWWLMDEQQLAEHDAEQERQKQKQHEIDLNEHNPLSDDIQKQKDLYLSEVKNNKNPYGVLAPPDDMIRAMSAGQLKKFLKEAPVEAIWAQGGIHSAFNRVLDSDNPLKRRVFADISLSRFSEAADKFPSFTNWNVLSRLKKEIGHEMRHASEDGIIDFFEKNYSHVKGGAFADDEKVLEFLDNDSKAKNPKLGMKFKNWAMQSMARASYLPAHLAPLVTPEDFHRVLKDSEGWSAHSMPLRALVGANVSPVDRAKLFDRLSKDENWAGSVAHLLSGVKDKPKRDAIGQELFDHPKTSPLALPTIAAHAQLGDYQIHQALEAASELGGVSPRAEVLSNQLSMNPNRNIDKFIENDPKLATRAVDLFTEHKGVSPEHTAALERLKAHPVVLAGKVHKFWNDYERKVDANHFAAVQQYHNGNDEPVELKGFRGGIGLSSAYDGIHKGIQRHAQAVQNTILKDPRAAIKHIDGKPHILVYRGVSGEYGHKIKQALEQGADDVQIPNAQFSSWTTRQGIARSFSERNIKGQNSASVMMRKWMTVEDQMQSGVHKESDTQDHAHPHEFELIFQHKTPFVTIPKEDIQHTTYYGHPEGIKNRFEPHDAYLVNKHGFPVPKESYSAIGHFAKNPRVLKPQIESDPHNGPPETFKTDTEALYNTFKGTKLDPDAGDDSEVWEKT